MIRFLTGIKLLGLSMLLCLFAGGGLGQEPVKSPLPIVKTSSENRKPVPLDGTTSQAERVEASSEEESAILPYYNNYLRRYHLGPEDVISVEVFGQPNYSKGGIVIPPNARISYPLVPGGVFVGGKTVDDVAEDIKKKLDEYIIDPQVTVTLEKVGSARYSVLGKVPSPGVKVMNRRYNLFEAIAEAGGIDKEGDKGRVVLVRLSPTGGVSQTVFDLKEMMKGNTEVPFLVPGDQVIVPEKRWSVTKILNVIGGASSLRVLFGSPF